MLVRNLHVGVLASRKLDKKPGSIVDIQIQNPICGYLHAKPSLLDKLIVKCLKVPYEPVQLRFHAQHVIIWWLPSDGSEIVSSLDMEEFLTNYSVHSVEAVDGHH
jgi:hypothetical protein